MRTDHRVGVAAADAAPDRVRAVGRVAVVGGATRRVELRKVHHLRGAGGGHLRGPEDAQGRPHHRQENHRCPAG